MARAHRIHARILALSISLAAEPLSHRISCPLRNARRLVPLPNCLLSLLPSFSFSFLRVPGNPGLPVEPPFSLSLELPPTFTFLKKGSRIRNVTDRAYSFELLERIYTGNRRGIINYRLGWVIRVARIADRSYLITELTGYS